jgi:hypothetical protein
MSKPLKIGITGTRNPITIEQCKAVMDFLLKNYEEGAQLHHGDCLGADVSVAELAKQIGYAVICHPPIDEHLRAFHKSDTILPAKSYFARNRDIVDATDLLLVVPKDTSPQPRGGTWYTHDYAVKNKKPVRIFYPSEEIRYDTPK